MQAGKPLLIIAEDVDGEASDLVVNKIRGTSSGAVKAGSVTRKAMLEDISMLTVVRYLEEVGSSSSHRDRAAGRRKVYKGEIM